MNASLAEVREQLRQNGRLRVGVWLIALIAALYCTMLLGERNDALREEYLETGAKLRRLDDIRDAKLWQDRSQTARSVWNEELKRFPLVKSQGVAKAGLENTLKGMLTQLKIEKPKVVVEDFRSIANLPGLGLLTVRLQGEFNPESFAALLHKLEGQEHRVEFTQLQILRGSEANFEMTCLFYFQLDDQGGVKP